MVKDYQLCLDTQKATKKPENSFILASSSPRRKELLGQLIENLDCMPELEEHQDGPEQLVLENAKIKSHWHNIFQTIGYLGPILWLPWERKFLANLWI